MKSFKRMSTRRLIPLIDRGLALKINYAGSFRLWKPRFDDVIVYSEEQLKIKMDYIHHNPVKAGLVKTAADYNFSSAVDWLLGKEGYLAMDKDWSCLR